MKGRKIQPDVDTNVLARGERPASRIRWMVVGLGFAMSMLVYLDRVCIGILAPYIMRDLKLTQVQMGVVFSAFTLAYTVFEIPTAAWSHRSGVRLVLTRIVTWWSLFTMATGAAFNYWSLVLTRFLFGAGEAGAYPCFAQALQKWLPLQERGKALGIMFAGGHFIGGVVPSLVTLLLVWLDWRMIFVLFGSVGLLWVAAWRHFFRERPEEDARVNQAELAHIRQDGVTIVAEERHHFSWRLLLNRNILALCALYFAQGYGFYFYITWLPTYLKAQKGFDGASLGFAAGMPLLLSVAGDLLGGLATDGLCRKLGVRAGRSLVGAAAFGVAGLAVIGAAMTDNPSLSIALISLAAAGPHFASPASWGACMDIGRDRAATVSACMNTAGQLGGTLSPVALALIVKLSSNWAIPLHVTGLLYILGAVSWMLVDSTKHLMGKD